MATFGDLELLIGDNGLWTGTVKNAAGQPQDLTGLTVVFTMGSLTINLTKPGGVGVVQLATTHANTTGLPAGTQAYDVVLVDSGGGHVTAETGKFTLIAHPNS